MTEPPPLPRRAAGCRAAAARAAGRPPRPWSPRPGTAPGCWCAPLWFVFIGWWLTAIVSGVAWLAMITIIGLPLGIWLVNRIPTVLTLRPRTSYVYAWTDAAGNAQTSEVQIEQPAWWIRGLWFVFVGWWASALVMSLGFLLVVLIITMPIGLMLYNRVPFVASLYRY